MEALLVSLGESENLEHGPDLSSDEAAKPDFVCLFVLDQRKQA